MSGSPTLAVCTALALTTVSCRNSPEAKEADHLRRGEAFVAKKDYPHAFVEFRTAALAMPKDAEPYYQMGLAYLATGSLRDAVLALRKGAEIDPKHQPIQLKLAELMELKDDASVLKQVNNQLESILSASPNNPEASDALAMAEWKLGRDQDAEDRLEETLEKFPSRLQTSVALARLKLVQKDLPAAEAVLRKAVANAPQSSQAVLALGQLYMVANEPAKAETELRKAIELDGKNGPALMSLAAVQIAGKRTAEAEETYRQLSSLPDPQFKPVHALFLYREGKRDAALMEFEQLARQDPNSREARSRLFSAYLAMGRKEAAVNLLDAALKKNPKDVDALYQKAGLALREGNADEAERDLRVVLGYKPDFAEGHVAMAEVDGAKRMVALQRQELREALRLNPALWQARLTLARSFTAAKDGKSALEVLNGAPANQQGMLGVVAERNWALMAVGETKEMRAVLDRALRIGRFPEIVLQDAVLRLQQGDYPGARADAEELVAKNPEDLRALRLLAVSYLAQKQPAKAEQPLKAAAAAHPQSAPLANLLGQWYLNANNLPAARQAFEAALAADPKFLTASLALAGIDFREKQWDAARKRLEAVVTADPKNVEGLLRLGMIAEQTGDPEGAMRQYRAVLTLDGNNVAALNDLASALASSQPDVALTYAQHAVELAPDNATVVETIGWVYYKKAIYATAVTYLESAVSKEPTPRRQFHLALCYLKSGNMDQGQKTMQLALRQDPNLPVTEKGW